MVIINKNSRSSKKNQQEKVNLKADINDLVLNLTDSRGKEKLMKLSFL